MSAHDTILGAARLGEVILYFTVFAGRPAETSGADLAWAIRESERRKAAKVPAPAEAPTGRLRAAVDGLLWHLLRDPSLGTCSPGGPGSWFVYRQHGVKDARVPDLACVYRLEADELVLGGIRVAVDDEEDEDAEAAVRPAQPSVPSSISRASRAAWVRLVVPSLRKMWRRWTFTVVSQIASSWAISLFGCPAGQVAAQHLELLGCEQLGRELRATGGCRLARSGGRRGGHGNGHRGPAHQHQPDALHQHGEVDRSGEESRGRSAWRQRPHRHRHRHRSARPTPPAGTQP